MPLEARPRAGRHLGPPADAAHAARLGFRVAGVDVVSDLTPARAQIGEVAALLGHPARGEALIAEIDAAQQRLRQARRPGSSRALLIGNDGHRRSGQPCVGADGGSGPQPPPGAPKATAAMCRWSG